MYTRKKRAISTLVIALFLLSTFAMAIPFSLAAIDDQGDIVFASDGTSMPEWTTTGPTGFSGVYCVEATADTDRLQVVVAYGEPLSTLVGLTDTKGPSTVLDVGINVYYPTTSMAPYMVLLLDTTGSGDVDAAVVGSFTHTEIAGGPPVYGAWNLAYKLLAGWWQIRDVDAYGVLISGTYSGPYNDEGVPGSGNDVSLPGLDDSTDFVLTDPIVLYIGSGVVSNTGASYIDDIIIGDVTYPLEQEFGDLDHFTMTGYPTTCVEGVAWTTTADDVTVTALDVYDNVKTDYIGTVTWTSNDPDAVLPADYIFTAGDAGQKTFLGSGFTLNTVGPKRIAVTDGAISLTSSYILVLESGAPADGVSIDDVTDTNYDPITEGVYGDTVIVGGSGVTSGATVNLYWDYVNADGLVNNTEALPSGDFEVWFDVPEATCDIFHYLWVKDMDTGGTDKVGPFIIVPKISLSPKSGLSKDDVTIKGYGFSEEVDITSITFETVSPFTTSPSTPETDELGSWTATFDVPALLDPETYTVTAIDENINEAFTIFTVGASISFDVDEGPVGILVEIRGRGFFESIEDIIPTDFTAVKIGAYDCRVIDGDTIGTDGKFEIEVVIPQVDDVGEFEITVTPTRVDNGSP